MGEAVAAIAGDFDVEDGVAVVRFGGLDGQAGVGESIGGLVGIEGLGEEVAEPLKADLHGAIHNAGRGEVPDRDRRLDRLAACDVF